MTTSNQTRPVISNGHDSDNELLRERVGVLPVLRDFGLIGDHRGLPSATTRERFTH